MTRGVVLGCIVGILSIGAAPGAARAEPAQTEPAADQTATPTPADAQPLAVPPAPYPSGDPAVKPQAPDSEHPPRRPGAPGVKRRKTIPLIVGLLIFADAYAGSLVTYAFNPNLYGSKLLIPVAGPWISLGNVDRATVNSFQKTIDRGELLAQGIFQSAGLIATVIGVALYATSGQPDNALEKRSLSFQLTPTSGGAFGGLQGRF